MAAPILGLIARGYTSHAILNSALKHFPQHAGKIEGLYALGYTADNILRSMTKDKESNPDDYLTENEKHQKNIKSQRRNAVLAPLGAVAAAGAVAGGASALMSRNRAQPQQYQVGAPPPRPPGALPSQVQQRLPNSPRPQGGAPQQPQAPQQLGYNPPAQRQPRNQPPAPTQPNAPIVPEYKHNPQTNVALVKNLKEDQRIGQALQSGLSIPAVEQALRQSLPKSKLALLDRAPGGFNQVLEDYGVVVQQQQAMERFNQGRQGRQQPGLVQQETERFEENYPQDQEQPQEDPNQMQFEFDSNPLQDQAPQQQQAQEMQDTTDGIPQEQPEDQSQIQQRVNEFSKIRVPDLSPKLRKKSFSIPNYRSPGESGEDYANRKIILSAVNKAAKAISEGKSFTDFLPGEKGSSLSTASDVLRFLAGIPNVYDPLLDYEDKQELFEAMSAEGFEDTESQTSPGMRPTQGGGNIHGAQLAPNMVWNLLLTLTPQLAYIERPKSVKGSQTTKGGKMGSSEMRRSLNHMVYGALSGKTISLELADKIDKISKVAAGMDALAEAANAGNMRRMELEMEKLMDDQYFMEAMDIELEDMILSPQQKEKAALRAKEDTKLAASLKAKATREKNKKGKDED